MAVPLLVTFLFYNAKIIMKIILHCCCAPCSAAILEWMLQNGWEQVKRGLTSWSALIHFAAIDLSEASTGVEGVDAAA